MNVYICTLKMVLFIICKCTPIKLNKNVCRLSDKFVHKAGIQSQVFDFGAHALKHYAEFFLS